MSIRKTEQGYRVIHEDAFQRPKGDDGLYFFTSTNHDFQNVVYGVRQLRCEERLIACLASGAEVIKFMGQP